MVLKERLEKRVITDLYLFDMSYFIRPNLDKEKFIKELEEHYKTQDMQKFYFELMLGVTLVHSYFETIVEIVKKDKKGQMKYCKIILRELRKESFLFKESYI